MYQKNPMYHSWERIHLQRKNFHNIVLKVTNHVHKKVAPIHPSVCWTPRAIASPKWVVGAPYLTSPLVCEEIIFVRLLKDIKRRQKLLQSQNDKKFYCTCCYPISYVQCCWSQSPG
jgi:hypothetical protein